MGGGEEAAWSSRAEALWKTGRTADVLRPREWRRLRCEGGAGPGSLVDASSSEVGVGGQEKTRKHLG